MSKQVDPEVKIQYRNFWPNAMLPFTTMYSKVTEVKTAPRQKLSSVKIARNDQIKLLWDSSFFRDCHGPKYSDKESYNHAMTDYL